MLPRILHAVEDTAAKGAKIAVCPESCVFGWKNPDAHRMAQPIPTADSDYIA